MTRRNDDDEPSRGTAWGRASVAISTGTAFVALAVAVTQERPASSIALTVLILGALIVASRGFVRGRRKSSDVYRGRRLKAVACGWVALAIALVTVFSVASIRDPVIHDILGFTRKPNHTDIASVRVLDSTRAFDILTTVRNDAPSSLVTNVTIRVGATSGPSNCAAYPYMYSVKPTLQVLGNGVRHTTNSPHVAAAVADSSVPGAVELGFGQVSGWCRDQILMLAFPTSIILPAHGFVTFVFRVPKQFTVARDESPPIVLREREANGRDRTQHVRPPHTHTIDVVLPANHVSPSGNPTGGYLVLALTVSKQARPISTCWSVRIPWDQSKRDPCTARKIPGMIFPNPPR